MMIMKRSSVSLCPSVSTNLPVMVYLFGGAFLLGASNDVAILGDSLYDGKEMADRGDVIIVTVNYRVGTMGFLSSGDARLPGLTPTLTLAPLTLPFESRPLLIEQMEIHQGTA